MVQHSRPYAFSLFLSFCFLANLATALAATKKPPVHPINLNSATSEELQQVPGIGPATADKILQMRKSYGAFKTVDDLLAIRGIGKKRLDKMRKYLVAGRAAPPARSSSPGRSPQVAATSKSKSLPPSGKSTAPPIPSTEPDEEPQHH